MKLPRHNGDTRKSTDQSSAPKLRKHWSTGIPGSSCCLPLGPSGCLLRFSGTSAFLLLLRLLRYRRALFADCQVSASPPEHMAREAERPRKEPEEAHRNHRGKETPAATTGLHTTDGELMSAHLSWVGRRQGRLGQPTMNGRGKGGRTDLTGQESLQAQSGSTQRQLRRRRPLSSGSSRAHVLATGQEEKPRPPSGSIY